MACIDFEGRAVPVRPGDTIASALYRAGVRLFSRSFKYHRRRGLYCLTGDCPNCLVTVDGEPGTRACITPALDGQKVARERGWPSADFDVVSAVWFLRWLLPVGFYYKAMLRPRAVWPLAERVIRRLGGVGRARLNLPLGKPEAHHHHADVAVAGGGVAGLSAALAAAEAGQSVVLADEGAIGEAVPPGPTKTKIDALLHSVRRHPNITLLERGTVVGIYEGPLVPVAGGEALHVVHPTHVVVATGAVEQHAVFPGSDLVGVWLGRGAARMAGVHSLAPGQRVVFAGATAESIDHLNTLQGTAVRIAAAVVPTVLRDRVPAGIPVIVDGTVVGARGRRSVRGAVVEHGGRREVIRCDALVLSLGLIPRDGLLRQGAGLPVVGAGEVVVPGCTVEEAEADGRVAARGVASASVDGHRLPPTPQQGFICLCEDVNVRDLEDAWSEGFQSTELLKRYTTVTMGSCQGALCHAHLRAFVAGQGAANAPSGPTTARPPARPVRLQDVAAGTRYAVELRTALHERHVAMGAEMAWWGAWKRPNRYRDVAEEYWAVRRKVSVMDVGTLGKFLVSGRDATEFLERLYPCHVRDLGDGQMRYTVALNEAGYIFDDGLISACGPRGYYLTFTTAGADAAESWLREWAETWRLKVHILNQTAANGAINVAGPRARQLLERLASEPLHADVFRHSHHREMHVAGVLCRVLRSGFVGELSYELHHPSRHSIRLWDALLDAGAELDIVPHGMWALLLLRLEKGHIVVGMDTDFDTTPAKVGMHWAVKMQKPYFLGKAALQRIAQLPSETKLARLTFPGRDIPPEGATLAVNGIHVGYLTSARFSPILGHGVALGWVRRIDGAFPEQVQAGTMTGTVVSGAFYDPQGVKLRA